MAHLSFQVGGVIAEILYAAFALILSVMCSRYPWAWTLKTSGLLLLVHAFFYSADSSHHLYGDGRLIQQTLSCHKSWISWPAFALATLAAYVLGKVMSPWLKSSSVLNDPSQMNLDGAHTSPAHETKIRDGQSHLFKALGQHCFCLVLAALVHYSLFAFEQRLSTTSPQHDAVFVPEHHYQLQREVQHFTEGSGRAPNSEWIATKTRELQPWEGFTGLLIICLGVSSLLGVYRSWHPRAPHRPKVSKEQNSGFRIQHGDIPEMITTLVVCNIAIFSIIGLLKI